MTRIGVRELRQNASRYLALVKAGETVEVTERGELVAVLAPPSPAATARERLIAEGRLIPDLLEVAADLAPPSLRSLDAVHLATALNLGSALDAFVVYDERLAQAATDAGLPVVTPS